MSQGTTPDPEEESEWRFSIDEVGPDAEPDRPEPDPIEPEPVSLEHAVFVGVGIVLTLAVIATGL